MEITPKRAYYNELLTGGFVMGLLYALQVVAVYLLNGDESFAWLFMIYGIAVTAYCQLYFGRRIAAIKNIGGVGFSYLAALGSTVKMMLLSGIVVGFVSWLIQNVVDVQYGALIQRTTVEQSLAAFTSPTDEQIKAAKMVATMMTSVWGLIVIYMFSMLLNGTFVGLITSAFIKRKPDIFSEND